MLLGDRPTRASTGHLKIRELLARIEPEGITEIILCTNPNTEGEVTAMYLAPTNWTLGAFALDNLP